MSEKSFETYLEFSYSKLNLAVFDKSNNKLEYYKEQPYESYIKKNKELNFDKLQKLVEDNIHEVEKSIDVFIKDIYLMVETPQTISIKLSVMKNNEGKKIVKHDAMYSIQDAKQQILKSYLDIQILHIIVENYMLDNVKYDFLPLEKKCKKFSIDINFICFPRDLLKKFEKLFLQQEVFINQFLCSNYVKDFDYKDKKINICEMGRNIVKGFNKQEVVLVPKVTKKTGFFTKLFGIFE